MSTWADGAWSPGVWADSAWLGLASTPHVPTTYYVSPTGSDAADGLSTATAWATAAKVQATAVSGDTAYFEGGGTWYEQLTTTTGVTYNVYANAAGITTPPVFSGADPVTGWTLDTTAGGGSAPAFVKTVGTATATTTGTTIAVTVPAGGAAAGNRIVVRFLYSETGTSHSVSDSKGNAYAQDAIRQTGAMTVAIYSAHCATALLSGDTITVTGGSCARRLMAVDEYSGIAASAAVDVTQQSSATGSVAADTALATTTDTADELAIVAIGWQHSQTTAGSVTPDAAYSETSDLAAGASGNWKQLETQHKILTATGTQRGTGTLSTAATWSALIVTYRSSKTVAAPANRYVSPVCAWTPNYVWTEKASGVTVNQKAATLAACDAAGEWFYNPADQRVYLVTSTGVTPDDAGTTIWVGRRASPIYGVGTQNVTIKNLCARFGNGTSQEGVIHAYDNTSPSSGWHVEGCVMEWSGGVGLALGGGSTLVNTCTLVGNTARYNREHGFQPGYMTGSSATGNTAYGNGRQGFGLVWKNGTVQNNTATYNGNALDLWGASHRATVQGYDHGFYVVGSAAYLQVGGGNSVTSNTAHHNAKAGLATDALSDSNTLSRNLSYSNLFGIFFEGGTENGSQGNKAYHNTCYNNTKSALHVTNGHGWFDARDNLFFWNGRDGSQEVWVRHDIAGTWVLDSGSVYKRTQVRWPMSALAAPLGTVLTPAASRAAMVAGSWFYDAAAHVLYVWKADSSAVASTDVVVTPSTPDVLDYNGYTPSTSLATGAKVVRLNPPSGALSYTTLSTLTAAYPALEAHGVQADPLYVDAAGADFRLQRTSPARAVGVAISGIDAAGSAPNLGALAAISPTRLFLTLSYAVRTPVLSVSGRTPDLSVLGQTNPD